jgi:ATP-dependent RNA circularization protein (DNA/RNA ligase family)
MGMDCGVQGATMSEYHKIHTLFKRDDKGSLLSGQWSLPEFDYLQNNSWEWTEKIDGTNIRVIVKDGNVSFGGKTDNASIPAPLVNELQRQFLGNAELLALGEAVLYGEGYGNKIQAIGSKYLANNCDFILFDIRIGSWWLRREDVYGIAEKLGIKHVAVIANGTLDEAAEYTRHGFVSRIGDCTAEGLVLRPRVELLTRGGQRIIAKIKHRDFEVKHG